MIWQQNRNSVVSVFQEFKVIGQEILDILIVNETKLHDPFSVAKFCINGFWNLIAWVKIEMDGGLLFTYEKILQEKC